VISSAYGEIVTDYATAYDIIAPVFSTEAIVQKALDKFWRKASSERSDYGLMAAESRKTFGLVTTTATRLANAYRRLKRLDVYGAYNALSMSFDKRGRQLHNSSRNVRRADHSRFAASAFLEMQYGWKPLLSDIHTSAEDLANRNQKKPEDVTIRASAVGKSEYQYRIKPSYPDANTTLRILPAGENVRRYRVSYICKYRVANQTLRTASALGLTNPALLAWDLLPFSFVVDWFAPIGNYLESLSALQGLQFISGTRSILDTVDRNYTIMGRSKVSPTTGRYTIIQGAGWGEQKTVAFTRASISSPSRPGPFRLNPEAMGSDRPLKALALLRVTMLGK